MQQRLAGPVVCYCSTGLMTECVKHDQSSVVSEFVYVGTWLRQKYSMNCSLTGQVSSSMLFEAEQSLARHWYDVSRLAAVLYPWHRSVAHVRRAPLDKIKTKRTRDWKTGLTAKIWPDPFTGNYEYLQNHPKTGVKFNFWNFKENQTERFCWEPRIFLIYRTVFSVYFRSFIFSGRRNIQNI
jgi:hypothetical protein